MSDSQNNSDIEEYDSEPELSDLPSNESSKFKLSLPQTRPISKPKLEQQNEIDNEEDDEEYEEEQEEPQDDEEDEAEEPDEDEDEAEDKDTEEETKKKLQTKEKITKAKNEFNTEYFEGSLSEDSDDNEDDYLQKFDTEITKDYIEENHPEDLIQNYTEILTLCNITRDSQGNIIDSLHKTNPILSKYEKTKILGQRTKQLNNGATPLIKINQNIIDSYLIAEMELKEKILPFIVRRPLANGLVEYWTLQDLEIL